MSYPRWSDVLPLVLSLLSDKSPEGASSVVEYDREDIKTWWNNAQIRLATHKPQSSYQVYKADDGVEVAQPQYHYKPRAVYLQGRETPLDRLTFEDAFALNKVGFFLHEGKIALNGFQRPPTKWVYVYYKYFPKVVDDKSKVYPPEWSHEALAYYVGMQAMALEAIEDARYRKFTSPVDATGNPTHNPFLKVAEWYRERYLEIINLHEDDDVEFGL